MKYTAFDDLLQQFHKALQLEIEYQKEVGGKPYTVLDGKLLDETADGFIYLFRFEFDVGLPDDTPVRLEVGSEKIRGIVVSADSYELLLEIERFIGNDVPEATLYCEPWELLVALGYRLREIDSGDDYCCELASTDMSLKTVNKAQPVRKGLEQALQAVFEAPIYYIWGPPGTGKTEALAAIAAQAYSKGYRTLVISHANVAVDQGMLRMQKFLGKEVLQKKAVIRYGYARLPEMRENDNIYAFRVAAKNCPELIEELQKLENKRLRLKRKAREDQKAAKELSSLEKKLLAIRRQLREEERRIAANAQVLGVTLSRAITDELIHERLFDVVLLDEVSMASIPQAFFAAGLASRHAIFLGDFYQLPPIALSPDVTVRQWLGRSLYDYLNLAEMVEKGGWHPRLIILDEQRRMHPSISGFINNHIYNKLLKDAPYLDCERAPLIAKRPLAGSTVALVDLTSCPCYCYRDREQSRFNLGSAFISMAFLDEALEEGITSTGLVTPFSTQGRLLFLLTRELFREYLSEGKSDAPYAATVHRFQGGERNYIIFDYVEGQPVSRLAKLIKDNRDRQALRLLNVAVSRARAKLIVMANVNYLEEKWRLPLNSIHRDLFRYIRSKGFVLSGEELAQYLAGRCISSPHAELCWPKAETAWDNFAGELEAAKKHVVIGLDPQALNDFRLRELVMRLPKRGLVVKLVVPWGKEGVVKDYLTSAWPGSVEESFVSCPLAVIDDYILWYAPPVMPGTSVRYGYPTSQYLCARLQAPDLLPRLAYMLQLGRPPTSREKAWEEYLTTEVPCPECGAPMRTCRSKKSGKRFFGCKKYPSCRGVRFPDKVLLQGFLDFYDMTCQYCGAPLQAVRGPYGPFAGCSKYPECKFTISFEKLLY